MTTMRNERGGRGFPGRAAISRRLAAAVLTSFAATVVLLGMAAAATGQETGGAINGRVLDHQGAVLPGVAVTLKNASTNAELNTVTNEQGAFVHPFVPIGRYILTATLQGFATFKREEIEVRVGDRLSMDLTLQVGALTEEITVSGTPLLETSNAMRGQVIAREQVQDLPLLGRNPFMLAQLSPGVQYTPSTASRSNRPFDNGGMDNFQISGGRGFTNEFLLDGVPNTGTETTQPNNLSFVPSPDATAEFRVQTSIYDAQYGRTGGGVVNVVVKSGTNQFHGGLVLPRRSAQCEHVRRQSRRSVEAGLVLEPAGSVARRTGENSRSVRRQGQDVLHVQLGTDSQRSAVPTGLYRAHRLGTGWQLLADAHRRRSARQHFRPDHHAVGWWAVRARSLPR